MESGEAESELGFDPRDGQDTKVGRSVDGVL